MTKILIVPGSTRENSYNRRLGEAIRRELGRQGASGNLITLADYPMPIFNQDDEEEKGAPESAKKLAKLFVEHSGVVLVNPEYNASLTPLMKNTLDWLSRDVGEKVYQNRVFALAACSGGGLGGIRGLSHVRDVLVNVGAEMITPQLAVGMAEEAFTDDGDLAHDRTKSLLNNLVKTLIARASQISA